MSAPPVRSRAVWEALRFGLAGAGNALVTAGLITVLVRVVEPWAAYAIAYALGLVTATYLVSRFVFRARLTGSRAVRFTTMYVVVFLLGLLALQVALTLGLPKHLSGAVTLVTAPLSFLGSKLIFPSNETAASG
ncbi:MAG: hypothetical protein JWO46_1079 [Nocardioidaceae bacterium]|nr:hypothetical protein [Nocardioidaceae bacterium]